MGQEWGGFPLFGPAPHRTPVGCANSTRGRRGKECIRMVAVCAVQVLQVSPIQAKQRRLRQRRTVTKL
jgi:hypothetical protein